MSKGIYFSQLQVSEGKGPHLDKKYLTHPICPLLNPQPNVVP